MTDEREIDYDPDFVVPIIEYGLKFDKVFSDEALAARDAAVEARVRAEVAEEIAVKLEAEAVDVLGDGYIDGLNFGINAARAAAGSSPDTTPCPTCQVGPIRETVGLVCQTCGRDYGLDTTPEPAGDERCQRCHGPNPPWSAPSPLWNAVMRGNDINGTDEFSGIVCATCFTILAEERIGADLWRLSAQRVPVELQTVTPSGRVWDDETWLWRDTTPEPKPSREEIIAAATRIHDDEGCNCDRKYLMSCTRLAAAILRTNDPG